MRPGVNVTTREQAPPSTIPVDVGTGFMVGVTEAGPNAPAYSNLVQNMDEYRSLYAPTGRAYLAATTTYDSAETFFNEGGNRLYVGRVMGAAALPAEKDIMDNAAAVALHAEARGNGEWGNNIDVEIQTTTENAEIPAGSFRVVVNSLDPAMILEESYDLEDGDAAIGWAQGSTLIDLTAGVSLLDPVAGHNNLTGGTNDLGAISNTDWQTACDSLPMTLGPGILFAPGATTDAIHTIIAQSAEENTRVAFLDAPDTPTAATMIASAKAVLGVNGKRSRFSGLFGPFLTIVGLTPGTTRKLPPSAAVAGLFSRNVAAGYSANEPAAGDRGVFRTVLDFTQIYSDADREAMNNQGVNICRDVYGAKKVYGWRTTTDPVNDARWINLGNSLLHRQIVAMAGAVGEGFIFRQLDGRRTVISEFGGSLTGNVCMPLWLAGSLYGQTSAQAYKVDVGPSVNTDATIANNELHAVISARMSPFGEMVNIEIVKYLVSETIPA